MRDAAGRGWFGGVGPAALLVAGFVGGTARGADDAPRRATANVSVEVEFTARRDHADPFRGVTLDVEFREPAGTTRRVPAFWAGGRTWRVRYASPSVGEHSFRSVSSDPDDAGLHGVAGRIAVGPYSGENPLYKHGPIRVADDRRHLVHADGTPFFWMGDTWWMGLCDRLRYPDEFDRLARDRVAKGFNVVQLTAGLYPDMPPFDPRGATDGGFPWTEGYGAIRPEFFDAVDRRIGHLVDLGISPCIVGMWGYFLNFMGEDHASEHWRYLIARYGAYPVTWCVAGEANLPWYQAQGFPFDDREAVHGWTRVARYVRDTDPFHRPMTIHPTALNRYTARHAIDDPALLDFDMLQTPHGRREAAVVALRAARESVAAEPTMPVINGEASFERLNDRITPEWTRAMFWICLASGAGGHSYGANGIWQCNRPGQPHGNSPTGGNYGTVPWDEAMHFPGSTQVGVGRRFLEGFDWPTLAPHPEWVAWDDPAPEAGWPEGLGRWIWLDEGDARVDAPVAARFFRREFDLPAAPPRSARLLIGVDDRFEAWVNGTKVASGAGWLDPEPVDVARHLRPGRNVLAIRAENRPAPVARNPAGLIASLDVTHPDGLPPTRLGTDAEWRAAATEGEGWPGVDFDATAWAPARAFGPAGSAPWGEVGPRPGAALPPLCLGRADGPRICYMIDPKAVAVRGLDPGRRYRPVEFDPALGTRRERPPVVAGPDGTTRHAAPDHGHDWALALVPEPTR